MPRLRTNGALRLRGLVVLAVATAATGPAFAATTGRAPPTLPPEGCADLWGNMSTACMSVLDERFLDEPASRSRHFHPGGYPDEDRLPFLPRPRDLPVRWRDVFDAPLETRRLVEKALGRADCIVPEGAFQPELGEVCGAEALARLGMLHASCTPFLARDSDGEYWEGRWSVELERLDEQVPEAGDEHRRRRAVIEEAKVHFAWRLQTCRAVPPDAFVPLAVLPTPPPHYDNPDWHQGYEMLSAALRLGSRWATVLVGGNEVFVNAVSRTDPVVAYVLRAVTAFVNSGTPESGLAYLMVAMRHDNESPQLRFDWAGWSTPFTATELAAARRIAGRVLEKGWEPLPLPGGNAATQGGRSTTAGPQDPGKVVVRRWITENGEERAVTADGTVLVTGSDY